MKKEFKPIVGNDVKPTARAAIFRLPSVNEVRPPSSVNDAKKMMELGSKLMRAGMNQTRMIPESRHILSLAMSSLSATDFGGQNPIMPSSPAGSSRNSSSPIPRSFNSPRDSGSRSYNSPRNRERSYNSPRERERSYNSDRSREESGSDRSSDDARRRDYRTDQRRSRSRSHQSDEDGHRGVKRERFDNDHYDRGYNRSHYEDRRGSRERSSGHRRY